ncbi:MAG TPA: hypothetical protein DCQ94_14675 [Nitrospira sp.]|jgi:hypothetical protein|nr:hypothetical protein [Nitrospira sp.]
MTPWLSLIGGGSLFAITLHGLVLVAPAQASSDNGLVEITGDYRYALHQPETLAEAKQHACTEALHQAVSNSVAVKERTASLVDSTFFHRLIHTLATQHVSDQHIVQQSEQGRTVYCKVKALFHADAVDRVMLAQTVSGTDQVLDQNRALRILSAREDTDGTLVVTYQALKRLDWLGTAYQGGLRESADVMVDFYDEQGVLVRSSRHPARKTATGDDVMNPGEVGTLRIAKPLNARSYRVWVVK